MWIETNENPIGIRTGDCAVRAISVALGISWEQAYVMLAETGFQMGLLMNMDVVWGAILRQHGFKRYFPECEDCITVKEFCEEHPKGTYAIKADDHVVAAIDGKYYDAWNSGNEYVIYYWSKED